MSLNYNLIDTFKLLLQSFKYSIMVSITISSIIFTIILILYKDKKIVNYTILVINTILIILICNYYIVDIITLNFKKPVNNIYFYFFNSIIYLIIMSIVIFKTKYKKINFIIYGLSLINILFSLFMTNYLHNSTLMVIGNIFPMIRFGNIIYIVYYLFITINIITNTKHKKRCF